MRNPPLSSESFYATRIDPSKGGSMILTIKTSDQTRGCVYVCVEVAHDRATRPCHPSYSMPLALIFPSGDQ